MNQNLKSITHTLSNGTLVYLVPFSGIKTVVIRSWFFVGSADESPKKNGISHFLEHMMFRGNRRLGSAQELNRRIEELGGEMNAATGFDQTEYWLEFHLEYLDEGIKRFSEFLRYPLFEQIEIERSIILEEILGDYNGENQLIDTDALTYKGLWPDQAMGMPVIGTIDTVKSITIDDLKEWYEAFYHPKNMVLGITGDFDASAILPTLEAQFANKSSGKRNQYVSPVFRTVKENWIHLVYDKDNQFALQWTFPIEGLTTERRVLLQLISRVLDDGSSSRLQQQVREERGLVYDISADMEYFRGGGLWCLQSTVSLHQLIDLVNVITQLLLELRKNGVTVEELKLAKLRYISAMDRMTDTAQGILSERLAPLFNPCVKPVQEMIELIDAAELEQVNREVEQLFHQRNSYFVLVGPWDEGIRKKITDLLAPWRP